MNTTSRGFNMDYENIGRGIFSIFVIMLAIWGLAFAAILEA